MIEEDYVSFETAKLLKERGFDEEDVDIWYDKDGEVFFCHHYAIQSNHRIRHGEKVYQRPTLQMAAKWLRNKRNIHVEIRITNHSLSAMCNVPRYYWVLFDADKVKWVDESTAHSSMSFETYEEAYEAGINYCVEKLI